MILRAIEARTGTDIFSCGIDGAVPIPEVGDIFVLPDGMKLRVLQRAYITKIVSTKLELANLNFKNKTPDAIDFEIQLACRDLDEEGSRGSNHAVS